MSPLANFKTWLLSDWGDPNFLTRLGVPRVVVSVVEYLLIPGLIYLSVRAFGNGDALRALALAAQNYFFWIGYASLYVCILTDVYLDGIYDLKDIPAAEKFRVARQNWGNPVMKAYWISLIVSLCGFFVGGLQFMGRLK